VSRGALASNRLYPPESIAASEGCLLSQVTVGERILVHLFSSVRFADAFECPKEMTQEGIAQALGISRAHAALELKRLRTLARVAERMAHVAGAKTRRKVYALTHNGAPHARALRDLAREKRILLVDAAERHDARGEDAIAALKGRGVREPEAIQLVLTSDVIDLGEVRPAAWTPEIPIPQPFVDREAELESLKAWLASPAPLAVILGVAGVGKTALATVTTGSFHGPVWYRKVYGFEDARTFTAALGDFLRRIDRPRLRNYLAGGRFDAVDLATIFLADLRGLFLLIDDVLAAPDVAGILRLIIESGGDVKILVTSRERPDGLVVPGRPAPLQLTLGGLPADAARALCVHLLAGRADGVERIVSLSRGHPLALRLLALGPADGAAGEAERLLEDAILDGLDPDLERAAGALAVLRKPTTRPALLGISATQLHRLVRKGLAVSSGPGHAVHDLVREVLLPRMPPRALRAAHGAAAVAASKGNDPIEEAYHLEAAGSPHRARDALLDHGPALLDSPAIGELARMLGRLPPTPESRLLLAEASDRLGRSDDARALVEPIAGIPGHPHRGDALLVLGRIASRRNALAEARGFLADAIVAATGRRDRRLEGLARRSLAHVLRKAGDLAGAERELGRAIAILESTGPPRERVRARLERATIRLQSGDIDTAAAELEELIVDPDRGPREDAAIRSNLGIARFRRSKVAEAADLFEASARAAEQGGDFRVAAYALANAADAYLAAGRMNDTESALRRAREFAAPFNDPVLESTILTNDGKRLAVQGATSDAEARLREGVERIRHTGNVPSLVERMREIAAFYEAAGRTDDAVRWRRESESLQHGPSSPPPREGTV